MAEPVTEKALVQQQIAKISKEMTYKPFQTDEAITLTIALVRNTLAVPTTRGNLPDDNACIRFMIMSKSRALNPFEGDCFLIGYETQNGPKFELITAHQAFLKRAETHRDFDGMESGVIYRDKESKVILEAHGDFMLPEWELLGGWARVHHKEKKYPTYRKVNLTTFRKPYGRWKDDPAGMIVKCAEADALRSAFPTKLGGLYLREEISLNAEDVSVTTTGAPPPMFDGPQQVAAPPKPNGGSGNTAAAANPDGTEPQQQNEPEPPPPAVKPSQGKSQEQVIAALHEQMAAAEVVEDQVVAYCREKKLCGAKVEQVMQMTDSRQRELLDTWPAIVEEIRKVVV